MYSVQHVSILKFFDSVNFYKNGKPIKQRNSKSTAIITYHCITFETTLHFCHKMSPNSINSLNLWHISDSGSKFKILKPNSSWLTFGISKFVSLSISHFLYIVLSDTNIVLSFWLLHLRITIILAITSQNYYHFGYSISKFNFILLYQTQH